MNENKQWHVVYTRPRWEKKVAETLTRRKIENYCPIHQPVKQWSDRRKSVQKPLFTSFVFVRVSNSQVSSLSKINGVINLVYWLGEPAVIRPSEVEAIRKFVDHHRNIRLEKTPMTMESSIRIADALVMETDAQIVSIKNKTVKVGLPSLGYMMYAEVETANVEIVSLINTPAVDMRYPLYAAR